MNAECRIHLKNALSSLSKGSTELHRFLEAQQVPTEVAFAFDLAFEELITNTIKYAYDDSSEHEIHVLVTANPSLVTMQVCDDGHPFDPTVQAAPDVTLPGDERPIGGLGLHLIRSLMDRFSYERVDGWNCVAVAKRVTA